MYNNGIRFLSYSTPHIYYAKILVYSEKHANLKTEAVVHLSLNATRLLYIL